jgi:ketosteroid isomerase-like protein
MTEDERAIRDLVATWMAATKRGDLETVLSLVADDVIFMVEGEAEIAELKVLGDWAYLRNRLTVTVFPGSGQALLKRTGYTLSIFRKERDGRWLLARDANLMAKVGG